MARLCFLIILLVLTLVVRKIEPSAETLGKISSSFHKLMEVCKEELNLSDHIVQDLHHYWKEEYELLNRDTGCAIFCMSKKLDIMSTDDRLHHANAKDFALRHGADEEVASKIVTLIHECEKKFESEQDDCLRVLEVAKCFRTGIHELKWAPPMDVVIIEALSDE